MTETDRETFALRALKSLVDMPMIPIIAEVNRYFADAGREVTLPEFVDMVTGDLNDPLRLAFHKVLAHWEQHPDASLTELFGSSARRSEILKFQNLLEFEDRLNHNFPVVDDTRLLIPSDQEWERWYEPHRGNGHYWLSYRQVLEGKGWTPDSIEALSGSVDDIMARLANPSTEKPYQSKGLVVGHVQSGKTSHFAGLMAKAISSGYKLIIVLTGTIEVLRAQTQRRLDMELVGQQNILQGRDPKEVDMADVDYYLTDSEWDNFVKFDIPIAQTKSVPQIRRLTTFKDDFKSLKQGLDALDFSMEKSDFGKPIYDPVNLPGVQVRLMVLKKNARTLEKVMKDLKSVHANLQEIPAVIIDDEADLASLNTRRNETTASKETADELEEKKRRTAINRLISELLGEMPRAQYVGYTATPFANVLVDPEDSEDIFPKDFIVALPTPANYMGGKAFHDLNGFEDNSEKTFANSNELAFVRNLQAEEGPGELQELRGALDSFVLTGAIKLFREESDGLSFRHHTMLAHTSSFKEQHRQLRDLILEAWHECDFQSPEALSRLWKLMKEDFVTVNDSRGWGMKYPESQSDLSKYLGQALGRIERYSSGPVVVLNSDKDLETVGLNFNENREWRILTGGAKLSRGFTIEGLTISYFRRKSNAQDSLMQMGRWFGFRKGYHDLVRLYMGRNVLRTRTQRVDLYDAFTSTVKDEEDFRQKLKMYSQINPEDGRPMVTPRDVPPLVYQQLPWLKPTSRNKMFNAKLTIDGQSQKFVDKSSHLPRDPRVNRYNFGLFEEYLLQSLDKQGQFLDSNGNPISCQYGLVDAASMADFLGQFKYAGNGLKPTHQFVLEAIEAKTIKDFFVMVHLTARSGSIPFKVVDPARSLELPVILRKRREDRQGFVGTESRNRAPSEIISGSRPAGNDKLAASLRNPTRGSMLLSIVRDAEPFDEESGVSVDPSSVAVVFGLVFPYGSAPGRPRVAFEARKPEDPRAIIPIEGDDYLG